MKLLLSILLISAALGLVTFQNGEIATLRAELAAVEQRAAELHTFRNQTISLKCSLAMEVGDKAWAEIRQSSVSTAESLELWRCRGFKELLEVSLGVSEAVENLKDLPPIPDGLRRWRLAEGKR